jgi:hypothetical protein
MELKPGSRWASGVCETELVVVRAPRHAVSLECGGHEVVAVGAEHQSGLTLDPSFAAGTLVGKRFVDESSGLEVLITKAGDGSLAVDGTTIVLKDAKPLPSSD